jgi:hypothetical protein
MGLAGGAVLGILGGVLAAVSDDASRAPLYSAVGGYVAGAALSVPALKWALEKHLTSLGELVSAPSNGLDRTV